MKLEQVYYLFSQEVERPDAEINLARAALSFVLDEYPDLQVDKYLGLLDIMAQDIQSKLPLSPYPLKVIQTINNYLFEHLGFQGNQQKYYDARNSFLNEVIDRGLGIPISLSVIYLEIRPDFEDVGIFVDPFNRGEILFEQDCVERINQLYNQQIKPEPHFFDPVTNQQIIVRLLTNLKFLYLKQKSLEKALKFVNLILLVLPNHPLEVRDRGLVYYQLEVWEEASKDLEFYLALLPLAEDADVIRELLEVISYL
jgi:regulator of sirC expression with transglutaminase-like and TPR domain